ncbi:DUF6265 family protein [Phenylobacterium sp.]|uniref:DUF6265 family protein n=1 Tax=Phenylobacterium sp. TaxID=1871053 RepID=UPI0025F6B839|nr:DUF6265 family protein [Phenylobacterium sp.]MBX3481971.1 hypothetical protein [Phenylobacterium sp.]MCW5758351.1 hypothetical protein [Phenylobacterium sp.]
MRPILAALAAVALASAAHAAPADDIAKLGWMAGSWIHEKDGVVTREAWLPPLGGVMAGAGQTNTPGRRPFVSHYKITPEPAGATFTAILPGQPPTAFVLLPGKDGEAVFENKAHDFPQRVIFRRCGGALCARIEGEIKGKLEFEAWRYQRLK